MKKRRKNEVRSEKYLQYIFEVEKRSGQNELRLEFKDKIQVEI